MDIRNLWKAVNIVVATAAVIVPSRSAVAEDKYFSNVVTFGDFFDFITSPKVSAGVTVGLPAAPIHHSFPAFVGENNRLDWSLSDRWGFYGSVGFDQTISSIKSNISMGGKNFKGSVPAAFDLSSQDLCFGFSYLFYKSAGGFSVSGDLGPCTGSYKISMSAQGSTIASATGARVPFPYAAKAHARFQDVGGSIGVRLGYEIWPNISLETGLSVRAGRSIGGGHVTMDEASSNVTLLIRQDLKGPKPPDYLLTGQFDALRLKVSLPIYIP